MWAHVLVQDQGYTSNNGLAAGGIPTLQEISHVKGQELCETSRQHSLHSRPNLETFQRPIDPLI